MTTVSVSPGGSKDTETGNETFFSAGMLNLLCFMEIFLKQLCLCCSPVLEAFQQLREEVRSLVNKTKLEMELCDSAFLPA